VIGLLVIVLFTASFEVNRAQPRSIKGLYRNPALGYSVVVPDGLEGITGDQSGPERGIRVALPSGGSIVVYGEPNSLEFKTPTEGVRDDLDQKHCGRPTVAKARIGRVTGAEGTLICDQRALKVLLAFRPGGGPMYSFHLETTSPNLDRDAAILRRFASSLKVIRWE
jgi:hypothetical protein